MPPHRLAAFRSAVAHRLREGAEEQAVIAQIASEQVALANMLADPDFVHRAVSMYRAEMVALHMPVSMAEAQRELESIFRNRIADTKQYVKLLAQPEFLAATRAEAAQPAPPAHIYAMPESKKTEIIRRLVQPGDMDGAEPAVHVAASARGHQITHQALANLFRPEGMLRAELVSALTRVAPTMTGEAVQKLAASWLKARHDPAHAVADGLKPDGALYVEAMRQAEALQREKLGIAEDAPGPVTTAPRAHQGLVRQPDLMVDAV